MKAADTSIPPMLRCSVGIRKQSTKSMYAPKSSASNYIVTILYSCPRDNLLRSRLDIVHGYGRVCEGIGEAHPTIAIVILDCLRSSGGGECVVTKRR
jgi:hypothetical protein